MNNISNNALEVISNATIDEKRFTVTLNNGELEKELYNEVNTVLTRLRGTWTKKENAHVFPYNPNHLLVLFLALKKCHQKILLLFSLLLQN